MKIESVNITNFRGIKHAKLEKLGSVVVVAGANGSGKSCIFDAIRLVKSAYGGYQQNEWQHWLGEFQINFQNQSSNIAPLLYNSVKPAIITLVLRLHPNERKFLRESGKELVRQSVWRVIAPEMYGWSSARAAPLAAQLRAREPEVELATEQQHAALLHELSLDTLTAHLEISLTGGFTVRPSKALELLFGTYMPKQLGVIDYHGPQRFFNRETVQGINLTLETQEQQQSHHALYNYSNKYANVKSEMAASFVKEMIAEYAGGIERSEQVTLTNTLKELFETFFPDKRFLGPQARIDGALDFPVETSDGSRHDLNELSAGEKEILFGYLRMRNSAPRYSIILIDEPEIHLNPKLVQGLPDFYNKHLAVALDNQVWLVTHSDAILREVVGIEKYSVYHMHPAAPTPAGTSQSQTLTASEDVERAIIGLVGDLAAYRPGGKVVIFEGGGDTEFDEQMVTRLFPELVGKANFISGGDRGRVHHLHEVLERAADKSALPFKIFSVTDRDSSMGSPPKSAHGFIWDVYHIENYLLESDVIHEVLEALTLSGLNGSTEVYEALRECARESVGSLVTHELSRTVNKALVETLSVRIDPNSTQIASALRGAAERSAERITNVLAGPLGLSSLQAIEDQLLAKYELALGGDDWRKLLRGRDILKRFAGRYADSVPYESFRNLIISRMRETNIRPEGMKKVVDQIMVTP